MTEPTETSLDDLTGMSLADLAAADPTDFEDALRRFFRRLDKPGASISGYNGSPGTERDGSEG